MSKRDDIDYLKRYIGKTGLVNTLPHAFDERPCSLSELAEHELDRVAECEQKIRAICDYLGIKIEPVKQKWQIRSDEEEE